MELNWLLEIQRTLTSPLGDRLMIALSKAGDFGLVWILVAVIFLIVPKWRKAGIAVILALLIAYVVGNLILKNLIARPRPYVTYPWINLKIEHLREFSFPSGHTITAFASVFALPSLMGSIKRALAVLAVSISFSRIYLFMHYPSDVLGGALLGMIIGYTVTCIPWFEFNENVDKTS